MGGVHMHSGSHTHSCSQGHFLIPVTERGLVSASWAAATHQQLASVGHPAANPMGLAGAGASVGRATAAMARALEIRLDGLMSPSHISSPVRPQQGWWAAAFTDVTQQVADSDDQSNKHGSPKGINLGMAPARHASPLAHASPRPTTPMVTCCGLSAVPQGLSHGFDHPATQRNQGQQQGQAQGDRVAELLAHIEKLWASVVNGAQPAEVLASWHSLQKQIGRALGASVEDGDASTAKKPTLDIRQVDGVDRASQEQCERVAVGHVGTHIVNGGHIHSLSSCEHTTVADPLFPALGGGSLQPAVTEW